MTSTRMPPSRSVSPRTSSRSSRTWATLCAETLAGIADPLFPALTLAEAVPPPQAAQAVLAGLLDPLDTPASAEPLPAWLLPHQADAVSRARAILRRFGGALVADGVGLGKTFIALALAALEREHGGAAVAIVPAALRTEWARAGRDTGVSIPMYTHTQLAHAHPGIEDHVTLVLVDEAHAFRNPATRRYAALAEVAAGRRLALLTATPLNNSPADIAALVQLFAGRDRFREFGVADLPAALRSRESGRAALALAAISVCRSRRLVQARFPHLRTAFPLRRLLPAAEYDLDAVYGGALEPLLETLQRFADASCGAEPGASLLHLALLRRLESGRPALRRSLLRQRDFLAQCSAAAACGRRLTRREFQALFPRHDADDTQLTLLPLLLEEARASSPGDLAQRIGALDQALQLVEAADGGADPKMEALEALLSGALAGHRTIVFTEFRDTALHVARRLRRQFHVLAVTGSAAWAGRDRISRRQALDAFAPVSRGARADPLLQAEVLVATDVASEGMNLQDASAVVSYDLPWNPVRVMQRAGRVDRLGALGRVAMLAHIVPSGGLRLLTGVLRTLRVKLDAAPRTLGVEPDPLASLWWLDKARPLGTALEAESWRRVEPFEAAERWRMIVGPPSDLRRRRPLIAAGIAPDGDGPAVGILLAIEWPGGERVPLPFVMAPNGTVSTDGFALGELAVRGLASAAVPATAAEFACVLASVLPQARAQLLAVSACRRGTDAVGPGRRRAVELLVQAAHHAERARDTAATNLIAQALAALRRELPAGLDRRLGRLATGDHGDRRLAQLVCEGVAPALPPAGPPLEGTPRLILVAAIALATRCPSAG